MRLFVAEKPSLARAIADVLPTPKRRSAHHIECGDADVVAWCVGHILEPAPPEAYDANLKRWNLQDLPIVPEKWLLTPSKPDLLMSLKRLLKTASSVVHAGDPDREGQLLVDEVLSFLDYRGPVERLLVTDLNPAAVRAALGRLEPNERHRPLSQAGLARQRADWLFGMNLSRLYTLLAQNGGYGGVLSVGRVQTPLLGLIVRRDLEIEAFVPRPYFVVRAEVVSEAGTFTATWAPTGAHGLEHFDADGRLTNREIAERLCERIPGQTGTVDLATIEQKSDPPPLPYCLSDLQVEASRRYGFTAKQVLDSCQRLYETHRLITYPRSDCRFLPEAHLAEAPAVLDASAANDAPLADLVRAADRTLRSRAWNDQKITAHHAIIPTPSRGAAPLLEADARVYDLIARRYVAQFFPAYAFRQTDVELTLGPERWRATGRTPVDLGWKVLLPSRGEQENEQSPADEDASAIPPLTPGERVTARRVTVLDRKTTPPRPFTDASLIQAMQNVSEFVTESSIRKVLSDTDGIGTEATRAAIIEMLFQRNYVYRDKKNVRSTREGRDLIRALPAVATTPDMTAVWETAMTAIATGRKSVQDFLGPVEGQVRALVSSGKLMTKFVIGEGFPCARAGCEGRLRRLHGSRGWFWACPTCRTTAEDSGGKPRAGAASRASASKSPSTRSNGQKRKARSHRQFPNGKAH